MPCLFLNTERGFGGKPPKKSGFRRHLAGPKMPKAGSKMPKETMMTSLPSCARYPSGGTPPIHIPFFFEAEILSRMRSPGRDEVNASTIAPAKCPQGIGLTRSTHGQANGWFRREAPTADSRLAGEAQIRSLRSHPLRLGMAPAGELHPCAREGGVFLTCRMSRSVNFRRYIS